MDGRRQGKSMTSLQITDIPIQKQQDHCHRSPPQVKQWFLEMGRIFVMRRSDVVALVQVSPSLLLTVPGAISEQASSLAARFALAPPATNRPLVQYLLVSQADTLLQKCGKLQAHFSITSAEMGTIVRDQPELVMLPEEEIRQRLKWFRRMFELDMRGVGRVAVKHPEVLLLDDSQLLMRMQRLQKVLDYKVRL